MLPAAAFKDESTYVIRFSATNNENTFYAEKSIDFVPVSCHFYQHEEEKTAVKTIKVKDNAGKADIKFSLALKNMKDYCTSTLWYATLDSKNMQYAFSPVIEDSPKLLAVVSKGKLEMTIPKAEQSKFPAQTEVSIIVGFNWINKKYSNMLSKQKEKVFQNIIFKLKFQKAAQLIVPVAV